jgi:hypothetical protein
MLFETIEGSLIGREIILLEEEGTKEGSTRGTSEMLCRIIYISELPPSSSIDSVSPVPSASG